MNEINDPFIDVFPVRKYGDLKLRDVLCFSPG